MSSVDKALRDKREDLVIFQALHDEAMRAEKYRTAEHLFGEIMTLNSDIRALEQIQAQQHGDLEIMEQDNAGADHARTD